jgi:CheY-like chemotaxis protein
MVSKTVVKSQPAAGKRLAEAKLKAREAAKVAAASPAPIKKSGLKPVAGPDPKGKKVLILDDEPEYLTWVKEFLEAQGLSVEFATTLSAAFAALSKARYRLLLVDMNVPPGASITPRLRAAIDSVDRYPGLALALEARNFGYGAHSVVAYTVHDDERIAQNLDRWHCRYVLKGRPDAFKSVIRASLEPAPR